MQRKSSQPWPSWLPLVFFCNEWIKQGNWWAGLLPRLAGSTSKAYGACACPGESTAQYFIWDLGPDSSPLEGLEGWACAAHCPSWDQLCGVVLPGSFVLGEMESHRPSMRAPGPLLWGTCVGHLMFNTHISCTPCCEFGPHWATSLLQKQECSSSYIKGWRWAVEEGQRCLPTISCLGESARRQSRLSGSRSASCVVE